MRVTFFATLIATASAVLIKEEDQDYANNLWAQLDAVPSKMMAATDAQPESEGRKDGKAANITAKDHA